MQQPGKPAYSIDEWCGLYGLCRATFYNLDKRGKAPRTFYAGSKRKISVEADTEWRHAQEAEAANKQNGEAS